MKIVRIGNGAGFWGDSLKAPRRLCEGAQLDYLTLEYLAELTMSILAHQKSRNPSAGWVTDFEVVLRDLLPALRTQPNLKIVTNAGGMNSSACAAAISRILVEAGLPDVTIGIVTGDDLLPRLDELSRAGEKFAHFETGEDIETVRDRIVSANAYLGAGGIVDALAAEARIVITGRVADVSLTVGPAVHEFGWNFSDWERLAAATVAGHLIECGGQCTGGMYSGWTPEIRLADIGYPIAEITEKADVTITKPEGTGGRVDVETVSEQLLYEIGDPAHYLTPDLDTDFTQVRLTEIGPDRVSVQGARGGSPPETLKVSIAYQRGFMVSSTLTICGPNAIETAQSAGETILEKVRMAGVVPARTNVEILGAGDTWPGSSGGTGAVKPARLRERGNP
ncbi:MAG TPA: acyclic terpene utilization AtuA family protein, partial [Planctomycetaceae bacterium]|nr:acyclic terpene utilization AtuA family protein [Planctomycetaceae bacterium]